MNDKFKSKLLSRQPCQSTTGMLTASSVSRLSFSGANYLNCSDGGVSRNSSVPNLLWYGCLIQQTGIQYLSTPYSVHNSQIHGDGVASASNYPTAFIPRAFKPGMIPQNPTDCLVITESPPPLPGTIQQSKIRQQRYKQVQLIMNWYYVGDERTQSGAECVWPTR